MTHTNTLALHIARRNNLNNKVDALMAMTEADRKDWFFRTDVITVALAIRMVEIHNQYGCTDCGVEEYTTALAEAQEDVLVAAYAKVEQDKDKAIADNDQDMAF